MKTTNGILKGILIFVVFIGLMGYFVPNRNSPSKTTNINEENKTIVTENDQLPKTQPIQVITATVEEILKVYETNEIVADEALKGKTVQLTGEIKSIEKVFGDGVIHLKGTNNFNYARCYIKDSEMKKAAKLMPNTTVTIVGRFDGLSLGSPLMKNCEIQ